MKNEISWKAFEYEFTPKSVNWFWTIWILAFAIFFTAHLFNNTLFGIFILISTFSISIFASRRPNLVKISLISDKILAGNKKINYSELESFWVESNLDNKIGKILLKSRKKTSPYIIIPLNREVDSEEIKEYLLKHLKEVEHHESFFQVLLDKLLS